MFSIRTRFFMILCLLLGVLSITPSPKPVHAYNICIWTGAIGNAWDAAGNWTNCGGVIPGEDDWVSITDGGPILNGSTTITRLDINPTGALMAVSGVLLTTGYLNMNGHFTGPGEIRVNNIFNYGVVELTDWLSDGILDGGGKITIPALGRGYIHRNGDYLRMDNFTLVNEGTLSAFSTEPGYIYSVVYLSNNSRIDNYGLFAAEGTYYDMTNNNTIHNHSTGTLQSSYGVMLETAVINEGIIDVKGSDFSICRGSPNSGEYKGNSGTTLIFGLCHGGMITANSILFSTGASITAPNVYFDQPGDTIDFHGTFGPVGTTSSSTFYGNVTFYNDATINSFGDRLNVRGPFTVQGMTPNLQKDLYIYGPNGNFSSANMIEVWNTLECSGTLSGNLYLRVLPGPAPVVGIMRLSGCTLNHSTIENQGNGWWSSSPNITLISSTFENDGTFNLAQGNFMIGDESSLFINNGTIRKELYTNTTTFDLPVQNNGNFDIRTGKIAFTQDLTLPFGSISSIDGILQAEEIINNGTLTVDGTVIGNLTNLGVIYLNGTVTGDLTNTGYMEIGQSPGLALVEGNFNLTSDSALRIELSADDSGDDLRKDPIAGIDFDQIQVTGSATVTGELILDKGDTIIPVDFEEYPFLFATGGVSGTFSPINIADMIDDWPWSLVYRSNQVSILLGGHLFIPFIQK